MPTTDFIQQLLNFRTSYLRGVARATVDADFRAKLIADPLGTLEQAFGYRCPWFMTLELRDDSATAPRLDPAAGTVLTLPYLGESITVYLPPRPASDDPTVVMDALAAYYHENPWFLHSGGQGAASPDEPLEVAAVEARGKRSNTDYTHGGKWSSVADDRNRNTRFDLGDNFDDFISFAAALFNALALSWDNAFFFEELTAWKGTCWDPEAEPGSVGKPKKTINILNEWLGYKYPWELDLVIMPDETAEYDVTEKRWVKTTAPNLMLTLPRMTGQPTVAKEVEANRNNLGVPVLGLALYNTDGPGYPFTCG